MCSSYTGYTKTVVIVPVVRIVVVPVTATEVLRVIVVPRSAPQNTAAVSRNCPLSMTAFHPAAYHPAGFLH